MAMQCETACVYPLSPFSNPWPLVPGPWSSTSFHAALRRTHRGRRTGGGHLRRGPPPPRTRRGRPRQGHLSPAETLRRLDHPRRVPDARHRSGRVRPRPGVAGHDRLSRRPHRRAARGGVVRPAGQLRHSPQRAGRFPAPPLRRAAAPGRSGPGDRAPRRAGWSTARSRRPAGGGRGAFLPGGPAAGHGRRRRASPSWPPRNSRSN